MQHYLSCGWGWGTCNGESSGNLHHVDTSRIPSRKKLLTCRALPDATAMQGPPPFAASVPPLGAPAADDPELLVEGTLRVAFICCACFVAWVMASFKAFSLDSY